MTSKKPALEGDPKCIEFIESHLFRSIRNQSLKRLLLVYFNVYLMDGPLRRAIRARLKAKGWPTDWSRLVDELRVDEVIEVLGVSRRTAQDYLYTLRALSFL